jgi:hypothetical protein
VRSVLLGVFGGDEVESEDCITNSGCVEWDYINFMRKGVNLGEASYCTFKVAYAFHY